MNTELTLKLVKRFPVLYQDFYSPMRETCMCWGFGHGDGWNDIIWQLSLAIEEELDYSPLQKKWFLFKKAFARRWNDMIYKLSPVRRRTYRMVGTGTHENPMQRVLDHEDPPPWDEKIAQFLFGKTSGKFKTDRMCLKFLSFHPHTGFAVQQVKEKFGTLRYYCGGTDRIDAFVRLAERLSAHTCEDCGKWGKTREGGWIRTQCDEHAGVKVSRDEQLMLNRRFDGRYLFSGRSNR
jgi:hypothetical protein